jgi:hypothetical protein
MSKFLTITILLTLNLSFASSARADNYATTNQFINDILSTAESKCAVRGELEKKYEAQGKKAEAYSVKNAEKMICECMPNQARKVKSSLSKFQGEAKITETQFMKKYMPEIVNKCAAEQLRSTYADGCSERFAIIKKNSENYCTCMSRYLGEIPDAEATKIGMESANYLPLAADAKKRGLPPPEKPPLIKSFMEKEASCAAD